MLMLIFTSVLAFYLAWNLGANDVANSMGTSVGSKAITLKQALIIAGVLEFTGAVLFGREVSETLATNIVNPELFGQMPQVLLLGMMAVLIACGLWLNVATFFGLPVSSSHATVGAIAGFGWVAIGSQAVDWRSLGSISLTWVVTPLVSGTIAALLYSLIKRFILDQPDPIVQLREWIPWLSAALLAVFGVIVLPKLSQPIQATLTHYTGLALPTHDIPLAIGAIATLTLTLINWQNLEKVAGEGQKTEDDNLFPTPPLPHSPASSLPIPSAPHPFLESQFARFQVLSACFVAFAHGSNDVGNAVAPLAAIAYIQSNGAVPLEGFRVPIWVLVVGGIGIVGGLAVWGKRVIATIGERIISLQPSAGFSAELATATTVLLASRVGIPVSTSHALVGGVIGVGLVQSLKTVQFGVVREIALAWLITIPIAAGLGAGVFVGLRFLLQGFL